MPVIAATRSELTDSLPGQPGDLRVLMADDDHEEHLLIAMALTESPFPLSFEFVGDGSDLLLHLSLIDDSRNLPDVLVLDLRMPGLDGLQTLKELQAHPVFSRIPVVMFTSSSRLKDEAAAYRQGAVWFETKPSNFADMGAFLGRLMTFAFTSGSIEDPDMRMQQLRGDLIVDVEDALLRGDDAGSA